MATRLTRLPLAAMAVLLALAGCATAPAYPPSYPPSRAPAPPQTLPPATPTPAPYPEDRSDGPPAPPVATTPRPDPSVTLALREESLQAASRGDTAQAIALIERAIRIEPDRPELWIDLARLHLDEGDAGGAEQFARKALLYTRKRYDLEQQAYLIISQAQRKR